jgi:hypothetical protein
MGHHEPGRKSERRLVTAAQRAGGVWAASLRQKTVFFLCFLLQNSFYSFCSVFEQIS